MTEVIEFSLRESVGTRREEGIRNSSRIQLVEATELATLLCCQLERGYPVRKQQVILCWHLQNTPLIVWLEYSFVAIYLSQK
uniref:Uncharacterized protein n=1 Tax=Zea mays TaxID=4577 RepID=C4J7L6_MAIZE|nr:unknown [Zea mays]